MAYYWGRQLRNTEPLVWAFLALLAIAAFRGQEAIGGAVIFGVLGAGVGAIVGAFVRTEKWHTVWLRSMADHAHASLDVSPSPTGARLGLRIAARL